MKGRTAELLQKTRFSESEQRSYSNTISCPEDGVMSHIHEVSNELSAIDYSVFPNCDIILYYEQSGCSNVVLCTTQITAKAYL